MLIRALIFTALLALAVQAQDSNFGISVPVTVSGGAMYTQRLQFGIRATRP